MYNDKSDYRSRKVTNFHPLTLHLYIVFRSKNCEERWVGRQTELAEQTEVHTLITGNRYYRIARS